MRMEAEALVGQRSDDGGGGAVVEAPGHALAHAEGGAAEGVAGTTEVGVLVQGHRPAAGQGGKEEEEGEEEGLHVGGGSGGWGFLCSSLRLARVFRRLSASRGFQGVER